MFRKFDSILKIIVDMFRGFGLWYLLKKCWSFILLKTFNLAASWEIYMQVSKQQLELYMEQQTGSQLGKEYIKAVYCHPAYLTCKQSTS